MGFGVTANPTARALALFGAGGFITTLVASLAVLVPLQRRIIAPSSQQQAIEVLRGRWFRGHLGRSALAVVSLVLVTVAAIV